MSNKLALCALLLVAFVFSASMGVDAQKRKTFRSDSILLEPTTDTILPEAEAANLDQCQNGAIKDLPNTIDCAGSAWANGSANASNSHYYEDGYQYFRLRFTGLTPPNVYTVTLSYDIYNGTKNGRPVHAYDFLGSYDAISPTPVAARDNQIYPCSGGVDLTLNPDCAGVAPVPTDTITIPTEPTAVNQDPGSFAIWGGNFDCGTCGAQLGALVGNTRYITVTFQATRPNPVLAWSAHISWRIDYPGDFTAVDINGASYHMRMEPGIFGGQQDRSLQASAVITSGPSAAPADIAGRVTDRYGRGIYNASVQLYDITDGTLRTAKTNSFGYYRFEDANVGDSYVMSVSHYRYTFVNGSISFSLEQDTFDMNFQAN